MTASRTCRACGAELSPDVRWCLRCHEPVRHLTPRPPQLPTIHFLRPEDRPRTSASLGSQPRSLLSSRSGVVGAIVLGAFVVVWVATDDVVRFYLVAAVVAGVVGLSLVVWNEL